MFLFSISGQAILGYRLDKKVDLANIIGKLRRKGLVDKKVCDDMDKIRKLERNGLQHNGNAFEFGSKQVKTREDLTSIALNCLEYFKKNERAF